MNNEKFLKRYKANKQAVWVKVKLTNGEEFYFSQYDTWKDIKSLCEASQAFIEEFFLQFRSHEIEIPIGDCDGLYFIRSILGQMGGESKHYFTVGTINGDVVNKKMFIIPELVEEKSYEDDIDSCFPEGIIYNAKKEKKKDNQE
tara:strand:- start:503 stop:934 length:432 start_codon:yes stop_codon:yes gene_type:complete